MDYRTERDIVLEMIEKANKDGPIRTNEDIIINVKEGKQTENQYVQDFSVHAMPLADLEQKNYDNYTNSNVATARGQALDNFGDLVHVARYNAQPLVVEVRLDAGVVLSSAVTVPAGTVVLLQDVYDDVPYDFRTVEDVTVNAGMQTASVFAESSILGYRGSLPAGAVVGLQGFANLSATNVSESSEGRDVEEDEEYRLRLRDCWSQVLIRGSREMIEDYLSRYEGIDSYNLIPRFDGVGTLKIVCDTTASLLPRISEDVYNECMLLTDNPPVCVLPEQTNLASLTLNITFGDAGSGSLTEDEFKQLVAEQVKVFVQGGIRRNGDSYKGLRIGEDFVPSQLIQYLFDEFPELINIVPSSLSVVSVADNHKFGITSVTVVIA